MEIAKMGDVTLEKLVGADIMKDKLGLYARVIVPPHAAVFILAVTHPVPVSSDRHGRARRRCRRD